jgi:hypothetical protein
MSSALASVLHILPGNSLEPVPYPDPSQALLDLRF